MYFWEKNITKTLNACHLVVLAKTLVKIYYRKMKIIGYSERGAMNALFYGMALKEDDDAMNEFIHLAGIIVR